MTAPEPRILGAPAAEYAEMQVFFRELADRRGWSRETIDRLARFTPGLASKLLAPTPIKHIGRDHIGALCAALAVKWVPVEDAQSLAEIERRLARGDIQKRNVGCTMHSGEVHLRFSRRYMRRNGKKGGTNSRKFMSKKQARKLGRRAAKARWHTPKVTES